MTIGKTHSTLIFHTFIFWSKLLRALSLLFIPIDSQLSSIIIKFYRNKLFLVCKLIKTLFISVSFVIDVAALKTSLFNIFLYFSIDDSDWFET